MLKLVWIIFLLYILSVVKQTQTTLASRKPAFLGNQLDKKSHPDWYPASKAVDDLEGKGELDAAVTLEPKWFVVDLRGWFRVSRVQLFSRKEKDGEGTSYFSVGLLLKFDEKKFVKNELCGKFNKKTETGKKYKLNCKQPYALSKYVSIFTEDKTHKTMGIAELRVYGNEYTFSVREHLCCSKIKDKEFEEMSVKNCYIDCLIRNNKFMALKNTECICIEDIGEVVPIANCEYKCDADFPCGSKKYYSVYRTIPCVNPTSHVEQPCKQLCEDGLTKCDLNTTTCQNNEGSYECICKKGLPRIDKYSCGDSKSGLIAFLIVLVILCLVIVSVVMFFNKDKVFKQTKKF